MISLLYVDDERGLLDIGRIFLERSGGISVTTVDSAVEGIDVVGTGRYDAIVSDYQMPVMDGIAFLKKLRSTGNHVPFILFTGRGREEVVIEAINNGADFYLQKGGDAISQFAELEHKVRLAVERTRTARALEESEEKYRSLVDLAPLAVIVHQQGKIVYANPESVRLAGAAGAQDLTGREMLPLIHPDDRQKSLEHYRLLGEGKSIPPTEIRLFRLNGEPFTVSAAGKPITYGGIPSILVVYQDITPQKKQEDELRAAYEQIAASEEELRGQYEELARGDRLLRESQEQLRAFMDSATDAFTIWDADLNLVDINQAGLAFLPPGMHREDVLGRNIAEFMSGKDEWGMIERYREVIRTGVPFSGSGKRSIQQPGNRWVDVTCFRVGSGLGIATRDITREKESEEELRAANARLIAAEKELREQCGRLAGRDTGSGDGR